MAASDLQTASAAERQRLLRALFTVPASATATECRDPKVLEATVQDAVSDLTYSSFGSVNPHAQHVKATGVATLLSRHAQTSKLNAFNKLKSDLEKVAPAGEDTLDSDAILTMLFSLSRNVLSSEAPAVPPQIKLDRDGSTASTPPSAASGSSLEDAYDAAWAEDDSLSDWDAESTDQISNDPDHVPDTPFEAGVWVANPSLMRTTNNKRRLKAYDALKATNLHLQYVSAGPQSPRRTANVPAEFQFPHLPIPSCANRESYQEQLQEGDLVEQVLTARSQLTSETLDNRKCFSEAVVARQSLEVILDRPDVLFACKPSSAPLATCLRNCSPPSVPYVTPFTHTRNLTHTALLHALQPFLSAAAQHAALVAWVAAVNDTAHCGASLNSTSSAATGATGPDPTDSAASNRSAASGVAWADSLPQELMCGTSLNPTVAALVVAIGEQLDVVDAAVHALQDSLQQRYEGEHSARGMLLHTRALVRPIIKRLALLYSVFQQTISSCLDGERGVLFPQPRHSGSAAQAPNSRTSGGSPMAQSRVTQIVVDRLYQQLLEDDQVAGRAGAVLRAILLHLLTAALRPTLQGMHGLIAEGSTSAPQAHLCLRSFLRDVPASSPQFWSESVSVARDPNPHNHNSSNATTTTSTNASTGSRAVSNVSMRSGVASAGTGAGAGNVDKLGSLVPRHGGGRSHVPRCLKPFVEPVASAAKAVVLLREYDQASRASLLAVDGGPAAAPTFPRLLEVVTAQLQHPDSSAHDAEPGRDSPGAADAGAGAPHAPRAPPAGHHCTHLMQQAAELLTDMHREQQTAVDALEAMFDLLATAASQDASDVVKVVDSRVTLLGNFQRSTLDGVGGMFSPGKASPEKWTPSKGAAQQVTALKNVQLRDHDENPIRVEEKVAWMSNKGLPDSEVASEVADNDVASFPVRGSFAGTSSSVSAWSSASVLEAAAAADVAPPPSTVPDGALDPGMQNQNTPPRVSLPPSSVQNSLSKAASSLVSSGTQYQQPLENVLPPIELTQDAVEAFDKLQQQQQTQQQQTQSRAQQNATEADDEGYGSDSSSDFSYRLDESDEEEGPDAEERRQLRAARKALQRARRTAQANLRRKSGARAVIPSPHDDPSTSSSVPDRSAFQFLHGPGTGANAAGSGVPRAAAAVHTTSDWDRVEPQLAAAVQSGKPVPPVVVADPAMHGPAWLKDAAKAMLRSEQNLNSSLSNFSYMHHPGRLTMFNAMLPGCTSVPAFVPVQGSGSVAERMTQAFHTRTIAHTADPSSCLAEGPVGGVHWQLLSLATDSAPARTLLLEALTRSLLQSTLLPRSLLTTLILGPCGLKAELQRLRGVLLMGSAAMQLWCGGVAARLNAGVRMTSGGDGLSSSALLELDALLQKHLCDGSMLSAEQLSERSIRLGMASSSHRGLPAPTRKAGKPPLIARISRLEVNYIVRWPLNVIVSDDQIKTYQLIFPVLLQVHWARHNLNELSQLLQTIPPAHKLHPLLRRAHGSVSAPEGSFSIPAACACAMRMRHVLQAFTHTMFDTSIDAAWHALCAKLDAAAEAARGDRTGNTSSSANHLQDVGDAHSDYLAAVHRACWLPQDSNSQVVAKNLHSLLDTILLFCNIMKTALVVEEEPQTPEQAQLDKGKRRRAGTVAMQLSEQFRNLTSQLIVSLGRCNLKIADGSEIMCLLESIQHSAFLGDDE